MMMINSDTHLRGAILQMQAAHRLLQEAGISERFMRIAADVQSDSLACFFGSFGHETGCFLEIQVNANADGVVLAFGVRRFRQRWLGRIRDLWREFWAILRGTETEYHIHLTDDEIGRFKEALRALEYRCAAQADQSTAVG